MAEDFTDRYNTPLSDKDEAAFSDWLKDTPRTFGRDLSKDLYDYDLRGLWKETGGKIEKGHGPDTFKKPNHPTFSDESKYHGVDGYTGGKWKEVDGKHEYEASGTNLQFYPGQELQDYFKRVEPDIALKLPDAPKSTQELLFPTMMGPP